MATTFPACAPQKLGARPANAKGWTCQSAAAEYRSVIDLLRNVVAAVRRVFAPHARSGRGLVRRVDRIARDRRTTRTQVKPRS